MAALVAVALLVAAVVIAVGQVDAAFNLGTGLLRWGQAKEACVILRSAAAQVDDDARRGRALGDRYGRVVADPDQV